MPPTYSCRRALAPEGTLVLSSGTGGRILGPTGRILRALILSMFVRQKLRVFTAVPGAESLNQLRDLIESGQVRPAIDRSYPLGETPEVICYFAEDHARGKIVITV